MECRLMWIIAAIGALTLAGVFWKMKEGFGQYNLRAVGIVLIATLASLLALRDGGALTAAMGILGGIGGYLFGIRDDPASKTPAS
jgi:hypothetical protein